MLPLAWVDETSVACVVTHDQRPSYSTGQVLRVHLNAISAAHQLAPLDVDPLLYVASVDEEYAVRNEGLRRVLDQIGPAYERSHLKHGKRPRDYVVRPLRLACQNVIVGLGAIAQDSSFDGLAVPAWQTCEVPHVATHEANRALAALTLCDAFQNGGTMEIRFDRQARVVLDGQHIRFNGHPELAVPASLRRFGRTIGVALGAEDAAAITPVEARALFLAITPMPSGLRSRVEHAITHRGLSPERICFLLLSQVWREIEMDYLLATTARSASILAGGATWTDRLSRQAESEICRSAAAVGMLYRRLNSSDTAASDAEVRVVEDRNKGVTWSVSPTDAAVTFRGLNPAEPIPWTSQRNGTSELTVFPRTTFTEAHLTTIAESNLPGPKALLLPADAPHPQSRDLLVLRCPDRLADLDKAIEDRLLKSRISRG